MRNGTTIWKELSFTKLTLVAAKGRDEKKMTTIFNYNVHSFREKILYYFRVSKYFPLLLLLTRIADAFGAQYEMYRSEFYPPANSYVDAFSDGIRLPLSDQFDYADYYGYLNKNYLVVNGINREVGAPLTSINSSREAVGFSYNTFGSRDAYGGVYYSAITGTTPLTLYNKTGAVLPRSISNTGEIVGVAHVGSVGSSYIDHAIYYSDYTKPPIDLNTLANTGNSAAYDIETVNDDKWIVGYSQNDTGVKRAVLWRGPSALSIHDLSTETLQTPDAVSVSSIAYAVNKKGLVGGTRNNLPVIYDVTNKKIIEIQAESETIVSGAVMDINDSGDAVGWYQNTVDQRKGFLYRGGKFYDLDSLFNMSRPNPGACCGNGILGASKINNSGGITGYYFVSGGNGSGYYELGFVGYPNPVKPIAVAQISLPVHFDRKYGSIRLFSTKNNVIAMVDSNFNLIVAREQNGRWVFEQDLGITSNISAIDTDGQRIAVSAGSTTKIYEYTNTNWSLADTIPVGASQLHLYQGSVVLVQKTDLTKTPSVNGRITTYIKNGVNWIYSQTFESPFTSNDFPAQVTFRDGHAFAVANTMELPISGVSYDFDGAKWNVTEIVRGDTTSKISTYGIASNDSNLFISRWTDKGSWVGVYRRVNSVLDLRATLYGTVSVTYVNANNQFVVARVGNQLRVYKNKINDEFWTLDYLINLNSPQSWLDQLAIDGNRIFYGNGTDITIFTLCDTSCPVPSTDPLKIDLQVTAPSDVSVISPYFYDIQVRNQGSISLKNNLLEIKIPDYLYSPQVTGDAVNCVTTTIIRCLVTELSPGGTANVRLSVTAPSLATQYSADFLFEPGLRLMDTPEITQRVVTTVHAEAVPIISITAPANLSSISRFPNESVLLQYTIENWLSAGIDHQFRWWIDNGDKHLENTITPIDVSAVSDGDHTLHIELISGGIASSWPVRSFTFSLKTITSKPRIINPVASKPYWRGTTDLSTARIEIDGWSKFNTNYIVRWELDGTELGASSDLVIRLPELPSGSHVLRIAITAIGKTEVFASSESQFSVRDPFDIGFETNNKVDVDIRYNRITLDVTPVFVVDSQISSAFYIEHQVPSGAELTSTPSNCEKLEGNSIVRCPIDAASIRSRTTYRFEYRADNPLTSDFQFSIKGDIVDINSMNDVVTLTIHSLRPSIVIATPEMNHRFDIDPADTVYVTYKLIDASNITDNITVLWNLDSGDFKPVDQSRVNTIALNGIRNGEHKLNLELRNRKGDFVIASTSVVFGVHIAGVDREIDLPRNEEKQPYLKILSPDNGSVLVKDDTRSVRVLFETDWIRRGGASKIEYVLTKNKVEQPPVRVNNDEAITLDYLDAGAYRIELYVVDESGKRLTTSVDGTYREFKIEDGIVVVASNDSETKTYSGAMDAVFAVMILLLFLGRKPVTRFTFALRYGISLKIT